MPRELFDPSPEEQQIILIDTAWLRRAWPLIGSCEHCNPAHAEIPFDYILDQLTGADPRVTDYLLAEPLHCPRCGHEVLEKTLVEAD